MKMTTRKAFVLIFLGSSSALSVCPENAEALFSGKNIVSSSSLRVQEAYEAFGEEPIPFNQLRQFWKMSEEAARRDINNGVINGRIEVLGRGSKIQYRMVMDNSQSFTRRREKLMAKGIPVGGHTLGRLSRAELHFGREIITAHEYATFFEITERIASNDLRTATMGHITEQTGQGSHTAYRFYSTVRDSLDERLLREFSQRGAIYNSGRIHFILENFFNRLDRVTKTIGDNRYISLKQYRETFTPPLSDSTANADIKLAIAFGVFEKKQAEGPMMPHLYMSSTSSSSLPPSEGILNRLDQIYTKFSEKPYFTARECAESLGIHLGVARLHIKVGVAMGKIHPLTNSDAPPTRNTIYYKVVRESDFILSALWHNWDIAFEHFHYRPFSVRELSEQLDIEESLAQYHVNHALSRHRIRKEGEHFIFNQQERSQQQDHIGGDIVAALRSYLEEKNALDEEAQALLEIIEEGKSDPGQRVPITDMTKEFLKERKIFKGARAILNLFRKHFKQRAAVTRGEAFYQHWGEEEFTTQQYTDFFKIDRSKFREDQEFIVIEKTGEGYNVRYHFPPGGIQLREIIVSSKNPPSSFDALMAIKDKYGNKEFTRADIATLLHSESMSSTVTSLIRLGTRLKLLKRSIGRGENSYARFHFVTTEEALEIEDTLSVINVVKRLNMFFEQYVEGELFTLDDYSTHLDLAKSIATEDMIYARFRGIIEQVGYAQYVKYRYIKRPPEARVFHSIGNIPPQSLLRLRAAFNVIGKGKRITVLEYREIITSLEPSSSHSTQMAKFDLDHAVKNNVAQVLDQRGPNNQKYIVFTDLLDGQDSARSPITEGR